jgi:hypothetical protein
MSEARERVKCSCQCGRVAMTVTGKPILHAMCYCTSCRTAGLAFAQELGAPSVVASDGGTALVHEHRLTPSSPTRRVVATCCKTPMFLEFTKGHWLSIYAGRLSGKLPPLDMRIMTVDRLDKTALSDDVPNYATQSAGFMMKLLAAWAAMGFRTPKVAR